MPRSRRLNIQGQRFGRLLVVSFAYTAKRNAHWLCRCDCGVEKVICSRFLLRKGRPFQSCGCIRHDPTLPGKGTRRYSIEHRFFATIDTEAKAYWLGFISADGHLDDQMNTVNINLAESDRSHLEKFSQAVGSDKPVSMYSRLRKGKPVVTAKVSLNSPWMVADLIALGLTPRKALTLQPWQGLSVSLDLARHYWRGVFDGDGCIHRRASGQWSISLVGTQAMMEAFRAFCQESLREHCPHVLGSLHPVFNSWSFACGGIGLPQLIYQLLYQDATVYLGRKMQLGLELLAQQAKIQVFRFRSWEWLTLSFLEEAHQALGSWLAVSKHHKIPMTCLWRHLKRLRSETQPASR